MDLIWFCETYPKMPKHLCNGTFCVYVIECGENGKFMNGVYVRVLHKYHINHIILINRSGASDLYCSDYCNFNSQAKATRHKRKHKTNYTYHIPAFLAFVNFSKSIEIKTNFVTLTFIGPCMTGITFQLNTSKNVTFKQLH